MTTSRATAALNFLALRQLIERANRLPLADRFTLLKGLIPGTAKEISQREFRRLIVDLTLKGERLYDAIDHPGEGRDSRRVMGERDLECR